MLFVREIVTSLRTLGTPDITARYKLLLRTQIFWVLNENCFSRFHRRGVSSPKILLFSTHIDQLRMTLIDVCTHLLHTWLIGFILWRIRRSIKQWHALIFKPIFDPLSCVDTSGYCISYGGTTEFETNFNLAVTTITIHLKTRK